MDFLSSILLTEAITFNETGLRYISTNPMVFLKPKCCWRATAGIPLQLP